MKIEKEVFPACIQAPSKYYNKRKSTNISFKNKENILNFPGQEISNKHLEMDNKINFVNKWLADNEHSSQRKPFADLNINQQRVIDTKESHMTNKFMVTRKSKKNIKARLKSKNQNDDRPLLYVDMKSYLKKKVGKQGKSQPSSSTMDVQLDLEPIVIDDSQDTVIDKDQEARLKVLKEHRKMYEQTHQVEEVRDFKKYLNEQTKAIVQTAEQRFHYKVPFYKKSSLLEQCKLCRENHSKSITKPNDDDEVSILIMNTCYVTAITVSKTSPIFSEHPQRISIGVQTDTIKNVVENNKLQDNIECHTKTENLAIKSNLLEYNAGLSKPPSVCDVISEDLFSNERLMNTLKFTEKNKNVQKIGSTKSNKRECLVIDESDSDNSNAQAIVVEVEADIHQSCSALDYGVLSEVQSEEQHANKIRRAPRGMTPNSSNSSEKENFHPNKPKRAKLDKKKSNKK